MNTLVKKYKQLKYENLFNRHARWSVRYCRNISY